jgi:hypothetical protein
MPDGQAESGNTGAWPAAAALAETDGNKSGLTPGMLCLYKTFWLCHHFLKLKPSIDL